MFGVRRGRRRASFGRGCAEGVWVALLIFLISYETKDPADNVAYGEFFGCCIDEDFADFLHSMNEFV